MSKSPTQTVTLIALGANPRNKSGFSRKVYQVEVCGFTVTRRYGPVDLIGRKTKWARKPTEKPVKCKSKRQVEQIVSEIFANRFKHNYRLAAAGEVPA